MAISSRSTIVLALAANILVGVAKLAGGVLTGSSAMLSEAAHSVADCVNEFFLLTSLRRSRQPADTLHPFGYGMERFFWSLLAAVGIFVAGAGFSAFQAYRSFAMPESATSARYYLINYAVVAAALCFEGASWLRAVLQLRGSAAEAGQRPVEHLRESSDPSVKTVASEDTAALAGLVVAAAGLGLHQVTGAAWWEGVASALVALLLVVVAITLGRDSKDLLIGEAATPAMTTAIRSYLDDECPEVDEVVDLLTMYIGVNQVMLAARIDLSDNIDSTSVEAFSLRADREIQRRWPAITQVFIDPTRHDENIARPGLAGQRSA